MRARAVLWGLVAAVSAAAAAAAKQSGLEALCGECRVERFADCGGFLGLYFTEPYGSGALKPNGRVCYLPADGSGLRVLEESMASPNGIVVLPDGSAVLVGEYARKRVVSIPSLGAADPFATTYVYGRTEGGIGPDGMAFDERGNLYAAIFQGGAVQVFDAAGYALGRIPLPEGAGTFVTNLAFGGEWLYITEASEGVVWRVRMSVRGLPLFHQQ